MTPSDEAFEEWLSDKSEIANIALGGEIGRDTFTAGWQARGKQDAAEIARLKEEAFHQSEDIRVDFCNLLGLDYCLSTDTDILAALIKLTKDNAKLLAQVALWEPVVKASVASKKGE